MAREQALRPPATARAAPLTLRVLGGVAVERGGQRLELPPSKKTRALLAYLLVEPREHSREHLCSLFWDLPDDPRGALRWSLSRLRPLLDEAGRARIVADRDRVRLDAEGLAVDLLQAEALAARGLQHASVEELRGAAALFRGDLLEGLELSEAFRFQAWCTARREQARKTHAELLRQLSQRLPDEEALPVYRTLTGLSPADEEAHRAVMAILGRLHRPREALQQYDALREILQSQLGAAPSQETEAVRRALNAPPPVEEGAATSKAAPDGALPNAKASSGRLIGRDEELRALSSARVALLLGEPGIGKSRLLEELQTRATLRGRCYEAEQARPYGCIIEALRSGSLLEEAPEVLRHDLGALLSELAPSPGLDRARLFDAVCALFGRRERLLIDDLQWIDESSAALLHYLARSTKLQLLFAARDGELSDNAAALRLWRALKREQGLVDVRLSPLPAGQIAALLESRGLTASEDSAGNPLLALELGRARKEGRPPLSGSLAEALESRLEALDDSAQSLLAWLAALGRAVPPSLLATVSGRPLAEIVDTLGLLERRGLVKLDGAVDFAHDLMREAALRRLPASRRKLLHAALARALWPAKDPALSGTVARQALLGGEDEIAVLASIQAGRHALRVFANQEALSLSQQALPLLKTLPREKRLAAHLALLQLRVMADRRPEKLKALAAELSKLILEAESSGLPEVVSEGLQVLTWAHYYREDEQRALAFSLKGAEAARNDPDPLVRARALSMAGRCLAQIEREQERAAQFLDEAAAAAQSVRAVVNDVLWGRGMLAFQRGAYAQARELLEQAAASADAQGDHWRMAEAQFELCRLFLDQRQPEEALRAAEEVLPVANQMPEGEEPAVARGFVALSRLALGDAAAREALSAAIVELQRLEARWRATELLHLRAELDLAAGRIALTEATLEEIGRISGPRDMQMRERRTRLLWAELRLAQQRPAEARQHLEAALSLPGSLHASQRKRLEAALARAR